MLASRIVRSQLSVRVSERFRSREIAVYDFGARCAKAQPITERPESAEPTRMEAAARSAELVETRE